VWFAIHTLFGEVRTTHAGPVRLLIPDPASLDWGALAIATGSLVAMLRFGTGMLPTLGVAGFAGIVVSVLV
jgi:chromate transporter